MVVNFKDLREFIDILEKEGELVRTTKAINRDYQATALLSKMESINRFESVLFEEVIDFPGWRMMGNTFSTKKKLALALNTTEEKLGEVFRLRAANPIPPSLIPSGPVKENILTGPDILKEVPFITHHEKDAGRYISLGICVAKDPETGIRNIGIYRHMVKNDEYLIPSYASASNISNIFLKAEKMNKPLPVAVIPGVDPLIALAASHAVPQGVDEYNVAGGLRQEPVELVKCETVDLEVPAHAELVIEGEVQPGKREPEAPFGDLSGCYSRIKHGPIVKINAITHRNNPILQFIFPGHADYWNMVTPSFEAIIYDAVKKVTPDIVDVHVPTSNPLMCCISMKKRATVERKETGLQKIVILAAIVANPYMKLVIVVDDDIDIKKDEEILWALGFRFQAVDPLTREDRYFVIPGAIGTRADPSSYHYDYPSTKVGIDATIRSDITDQQRLEFERAKCVGVEQIDLNYFFNNM